MLKYYKNLIADNIFAYLIVLLGISFIYPLTFFDSANQYYLFAFGFKILVFLIYGISIIPAVILAKLTYMLFISDINGDPVLAVHLSLLSALAPAIAMYAMNLSRVDIRNLKNIDFRHVIFFILLTSIISSLLKYIYLSNEILLDAHAASYLGNYILGHIIGGLIVVYAIIKITPFILNFLSRSIASRS